MGLSYKAKTRLDKLFIVGVFGAVGLLFFGTFKKYFMKDGYFIPEEQKKHLQGGASYVQKKFQESEIIHATEAEAKAVTAIQTTEGLVASPKPKKRYTFSGIDTMTGGTKTKSPLGNTITDGFNPSSRTPASSEGTSFVQKAEVKNQTKASDVTVATNQIDMNGFRVDLKAEQGYIRRFDFAVEESSANKLILDIKEKSVAHNNVGQDIQVNFAYFNPNNKNVGGQTFSVVFNRKCGFYTTNYNPSLGYLIFVTKGDCVSLSYRGDSLQASKNEMILPQTAKVVYQGRRFIQTKPCKVPPVIIRSHKNNTVPILKSSQVKMR